MSVWDVRKKNNFILVLRPLNLQVIPIFLLEKYIF